MDTSHKQPLVPSRCVLELTIRPALDPRNCHGAHQGWSQWRNLRLHGNEERAATAISWPAGAAGDRIREEGDTVGCLESSIPQISRKVCGNKMKKAKAT